MADSTTRATAGGGVEANGAISAQVTWVPMMVLRAPTAGGAGRSGGVAEQPGREEESIVLNYGAWNRLFRPSLTPQPDHYQDFLPSAPTPGAPERNALRWSSGEVAEAVLLSPAVYAVTPRNWRESHPKAAYCGRPPSPQRDSWLLAAERAWAHRGSVRQLLQVHQPPFPPALHITQAASPSEAIELCVPLRRVEMELRRREERERASAGWWGILRTEDEEEAQDAEGGALADDEPRAEGASESGEEGEAREPTRFPLVFRLEAEVYAQLSQPDVYNGIQRGWLSKGRKGRIGRGGVIAGEGREGGGDVIGGEKGPASTEEVSGEAGLLSPRPDLFLPPPPIPPPLTTATSGTTSDPGAQTSLPSTTFIPRWSPSDHHASSSDSSDSDSHSAQTAPLQTPNSTTPLAKRPRTAPPPN